MYLNHDNVDLFTSIINSVPKYSADDVVAVMCELRLRELHVDVVRARQSELLGYFRRLVEGGHCRLRVSGVH